MIKKIGLGLVATLFVAGAVVFANTNRTTKNGNTCSKGNSCICTPNAGASCIGKECKKDNCATTCPDMPGCICTK